MLTGGRAGLKLMEKHCRNVHPLRALHSSHGKVRICSKGASFLRFMMLLLVHILMRSLSHTL